MHKLFFSVVLICFGWLPAIAQNVSEADNKPGLPTGKHSQLISIALSGVAGISSNPESEWNLLFSNIEDREQENGKLERAKNSYPVKKSSSNSPARIASTPETSTATMQKGHQFDTNLFDGNFPSDNTAAVSKGGIIVSVINSNITIHDTLGNLKQTQTIISFVNDTTLKDVIYDPYVIYDPEADRFCLVEVCGLSASTGYILLFVSQTDNPLLDGWYYYKIPVEKNTPGDYADYPKIAVSDSNIYITANLIIGSNSTFDQSVIYQLDKNSIYNGGTLNYMFWNDIDDNEGNPPFTLIPAPSPQASNYGEGMYFASISDQSGGSKIQVFQITNDITYNQSNSTQIIPFHVDVGDFSIGTDAVQPGTNIQLDVGDCRVKSAFYINNTVHCVFTIAIDNSAGYNGFLYARINTVNYTVQTQRFGLDDRDIAYPSLGWAGFNEYDNSVIIFYEESGASIFPGTSAIICDDVMNFNSPISVKQGVEPIIINQDNIQRWGDYSGTCQMVTSGQPTVWSFGSYGTIDSVYGNNIAELINTSKPDTTLGNSDVKVYPNPFTDNCTIKIYNSTETDASFNLYDAAGRLVKHLADEHLLVGEYTFGFSRSTLSSGVYHLVITSGKNIIIHEAIVVQ